MSNSSKVLSLKYRPQTFGDLIGQEVAAQTIFNSIKLDKIPNAYLFTGIRGVGKTTIARIVAKGLNCKNGIENLCSDKFCENCNSIIESNHIDVLEMDAASKTGVDDVRDLIEFSKYPPTTAKYKIFIIDEVHMLSKQAFNALLKTLEEPPLYLKFIFATTEIKKIPVTVVSRCQRFDLSRIKSQELFSYVKKIKDLEKGKISDDALKLICKISEGSVRDALSLLDRALLNQVDDNELNLDNAQKIFGYLDRSTIIEIINYLFQGDEDQTIQLYKKVYLSGVEPKIFLNDFLELIYYFKNIKSLDLTGTNFSLNDNEFKQISKIADTVNSETLILFWNLTIKALEELNYVFNQNLAVEMFLIKLLYLKKIKNQNDHVDNNIQSQNETNIKQSEIFQNKDEHQDNLKNKTISQIKNILQEEKAKPQKKFIEIEGNININNFDQLIEICNHKKEIKLKYELETNVSLVSFENQRIEISFNENLDKNFLKNISSKLYEWTNKRWIITLSKKRGSPTKKQTKTINFEKTLNVAKNSSLYNKVLTEFPDAELIDIKNEKEND